jgi:hypothetical protein
MVDSRFNVVGTQETLTFVLPSFSETTVPLYVTGNVSVAWKPYTDQRFILKKLDFIGHFSAVGDDVVLRCNIYKGTTIQAAHIGMSVVTTETDAVGDFNVTSVTQSNNATDKHIITDQDGIVITVILAAGDTFTCDRSTVTLTIEYV